MLLCILHLIILSHSLCYVLYLSMTTIDQTYVSLKGTHNLALAQWCSSQHHMTLTQYWTASPAVLSIQWQL